MVARAVTKVWRDSLGGRPSIGRVYTPALTDGRPARQAGGWCPPKAVEVAEPRAGAAAPAAIDTDREAQDDDHDPAVLTIAEDHAIIPRRRAAPVVEPPSDSLWTSHEFWMGLALGAGIVLVIKTILAVQAPYGIDWYGF